MIDFESIFTRIDYNQIGLTSIDTLKAIDFNSSVLVIVGDHTGSVDCFLIKKTYQSTPETLFRSLPNPNSKINCVEIINDIKSPKFLVSFGSSVIRGFNKKGKQFFGLELKNLTEPIKHLKLKWPKEVFVAGQFIYNHYVISSNDANSKSSTVLNRNCYISTGKINCMQIIEEKINHKSVTLLVCEDLIRVLFDSNCECEIETLGVCHVITRIPDYNQYLTKNLSHHQTNKQQSKIYYFCYGTSNGRLSMLKINFNESPVKFENCWEINLDQSKSAIQCITPTIDLSTCNGQDSNGVGSFTSKEASELCVGRADGSIEFFVFDNYIHSEDGNETVALEQQPKLIYEYNCGERLTSIAICKYGQLIICCTFTGCIFAFVRDANRFVMTGLPVLREDSVDESIEKDSAMRIEELEIECELLEEILNKERDHYQKLTSVETSNSNRKVNFIKDSQPTPVSALPYFSINDSFVLQDNAFYSLTIECEAPIDCILFQSETRFDLIDCERNSAVISLSDNKHSSFYNSIIPNGPLNNNQILTSFRCQANTTQLEIKISSIEGQFGQFKAYILTKVTPKSCQVRNYTIKALSMHRRKYFDTDKNDHLEDDEHKDETKNSFVISGNFSLNEAYSWLYYTLPDIPDKLSNLIESRIEFQYISTLVGTHLRIELIEGRIYLESDNVSTISILKDFITREATRRSIPVELKLNLNKLTISTVLTSIYTKLRTLIKHRNNTKLREAIKEIETIDSAIANQMLNQLDTHEDHLLKLGLRGDQSELDRLYGLITDLFIDYEKLNGNNTKNMMNIFKIKLQEMITLIETYVGDEYNVDIFIQKIIQFWQF